MSREGDNLRYGDRQARCNHWEPDRLLVDRGGSAGLSGNSNEKIVTEPKQRIARPRRLKSLERERREPGVVTVHECSHERQVDP